MSMAIISVRLETERDLVASRQRARQVASLAGFDPQDQTRIATAVSEIARNAVMYAQRGRVEFSIEGSTAPQVLVVRVIDEGPGIGDVASILQGRYRSQTGMGLGMQGARRLVDKFEVVTEPGKGTSITLRKTLPRRAPLLRASDAGRLVRQLALEQFDDPVAEFQTQNRELLSTLEELSRRTEELSHVNRELEDTNRGVVALYAELDEKAEHLQRADQLKSTFLSHMSHEFRTPLNSIMALSRILISRMDGPLTKEQEKQVGFIHRAATELTDMVNDLLDLAKVEAGKIQLHPATWHLSTLLGTIRGMMRPLVLNSPVHLVIEDAEDVPDLYTDEGKVAQILRNLISNAIKFTEEGEIRVASRYRPESETATISVSDTGIGIAPEDQSRVFEQFVQVESARQRKLRGTGLGLPLSRKLAGLLGGGITLQSEPGHGSTFTLAIPVRMPRVMAGEGSEPEAPAHIDTAPVPRSSRRNPTVLIIDDEEMARYLIRKQLSDLNVNVEEARSGPEGLRSVAQLRPNVVILDLVMPEMSGIEVLEALKANAATRDIPVIVHTSRAVGTREREKLAASGTAIVAKGSEAAGDLRRRIADLMHRTEA
jgi:signal transduction histidine kinase